MKSVRSTERELAVFLWPKWGGGGEFHCRTSKRTWSGFWWALTTASTILSMENDVSGSHTLTKTNTETPRLQSVLPLEKKKMLYCSHRSTALKDQANCIHFRFLICPDTWNHFDSRPRFFKSHKDKWMWVQTNEKNFNDKKINTHLNKVKQIAYKKESIMTRLKIKGLFIKPTLMPSAFFKAWI